MSFPSLSTVAPTAFVPRDLDANGTDVGDGMARSQSNDWAQGGPSGLCGATNGWTTSLELAFSVSDSVLPPQFQDMLYVRCLRGCKTVSLQAADTELGTINWHDLGSVALNVGQELGQRKHPIRDIALEYRLSGKYNCGMYDVRLKEFE